MSRTSIFFLVIGLLAYGGVTFVSGFMAAMKIETKQEQLAARKLQKAQKQAAVKKKPIKKKTKGLPAGIKSASKNLVGLYAIEVKRYAAVENAVALAQKLLNKNATTHIVKKVDYQGLSEYSVRIGEYHTPTTADSERNLLRRNEAIPQQSQVVRAESDEIKLEVKPAATKKAGKKKKTLSEEAFAYLE